MFYPLALSALALGVSALDLTLTNGPVAFDGFTRAGVLFNGQQRAPLITFSKDDTFSVNLNNHLTDPTMRRSTSIHWHGFFQHRTAAQDGPAFVTQCPIAPNTSFHYNFPINGQPGTFWYHSHLSTQYCDGLRGAIVVYDPDDPYKDMYDVDDESTVITLEDYYHNTAPVAQKAYFQTNTVPNPNATLINGAGRYPSGPAVPWAVVNVEQNKRYRFRVINLACRPPYAFSIQGHNLTIIEADGQWTDPLVVQEVDIFPAQRYSVVLTANQPVGNYWIFGTPTTSTANLNANDGRAILRYLNAPIADPAPANQTITVPFLESNVHNAAFNNPGLGGNIPADHTIVLNIALTAGTPFFTINNVSFVPPTVPALLQILQGAANPTDFLPTEQVFVLERDKLYEVQIPGAGGHPFHLHGHAFDVVQSGNTASQPAVRNFVNPIRRDVVAVTGNLTTFRFRTDNPGPWFLHCHIDWHLEAGLAIIFGEAPSDNVSGPDSQIHGQDWDNLCPTYDALTPDLQ